MLRCFAARDGYPLLALPGAGRLSPTLTGEIGLSILASQASKSATETPDPFGGLMLCGAE
jgi:hypothetical protein